MRLIALIGFYHTVSFFANGLKLRRESFAPQFPEAQYPKSIAAPNGAD